MSYRILRKSYFTALKSAISSGDSGMPQRIHSSIQPQIMPANMLFP